MWLSFSRPLLAILSGCLALSGAGHAQTSPSLREALDAAWALSPQARALQNRLAELDARAGAASSLVPGPPSIALSHRTDRPGSNGGLRESEAEVLVPLWTPGVRGATAGQVRADRAAFELQLLASRARLAAEVRQLAAQAALARIEHEAARNKLQETLQLADDVARRVQAGDAARVDLLQARSIQHQAAAAQAQADSVLSRVQAQWRGLTGLAQAPALDENPGAAQDQHPFVAAAQAQLHAAQARLALAEADRRDPVEVGLGVARERAQAGAANETSMKLTLRVPLGSHGRNAPRLAAARAEVDAAQAEVQAAQRTVDAEREAARAELDAAQRAEALAGERERLGQEVQALIAKAYRLGESDLPTRIRAEGERFDAQLAHARARAETRRAISKLNQAYGILP